MWPHRCPSAPPCLEHRFHLFLFFFPSLVIQKKQKKLRLPVFSASQCGESFSVQPHGHSTISRSFLRSAPSSSSFSSASTSSFCSLALSPVLCSHSNQNAHVPSQREKKKKTRKRMDETSLHPTDEKREKLSSRPDCGRSDLHPEPWQFCSLVFLIALSLFRSWSSAGQEKEAK